MRFAPDAQPDDPVVALTGLRANFLISGKNTGKFTKSAVPQASMGAGSVEYWGFLAEFPKQKNREFART
jgi:hypothetical protein